MRIVLIVSILLLSNIFVSGAVAQEFGMVMDVSGKAELVEKGGSLQVDLGKVVSVGDTLFVKEKSRVILVNFSGCEQWELTGPLSVKISATKPDAWKGSRGKVGKLAKLPVCYNPGEIKSSGSHEQGGLTLMNKTAAPDPMGGPKPDEELSATVPAADTEGIARLRHEFSSGETNTPALVTLVMFDLKNGNPKNALPYYLELKKREPDSEFVKNIGKKLE